MVALATIQIAAETRVLTVHQLADRGGFQARRAYWYLCPTEASFGRRFDDPSVFRPAPLERPKPPVFAAVHDLHQR
ncbi:hypothetical protein BZM27_51080 [Paraburkholderia steynii]|uniref:Uncharacterized protein n=1 Tax=Paraburkholderia steynii TaxID=1245441 RepID=A0A4R0XB16_9BURK|nr:hypothetical protein BZM27_51080 [Paraburkholderia steynii]